MPGKNPGSQRKKLEQAIATQESLRGTVEDAIINATVAALKKELASLEPPPQQRKLATILFMDIAGHTALTVNLDPEEQMAVVDPAIARLAAKVEEHGGHVARYQGDGFKAVFGLPLAQENDPEQAIRAGLAIQHEAARIAQELVVDKNLQGFSVRVGITTGMVFSGGETEGEDTIKGPAVNLAARLESAATPGTILISKDTLKLVHGKFDTESLEPILVKGFSDPVAVYQVLQARPYSFHQRRRGIAGIETDMVGREGEMKLLRDACELLELDPQVQVVTLVGEAGLGKSRLMFEFDQWLADRQERTNIFRGRCPKELQHSPNSLLSHMLASRWNFLGNHSIETTRKRLEIGLQEGLPDDEEFQRKADFCGYFLGYYQKQDLDAEVMLSEPQQVRDRAVKYLIEYFENLSFSRPVILLLEDIHWADDSSLDFLNTLALRLEHRALLAVCAARPSLYHRRSYWGEGQPYHTRLDLRPLNRLDSRRLIAQIFPPVEQQTEKIYRLIADQAEGNPFFLEESINLLIEQGAIVRQAETWAIQTSTLNDTPVPQTLTEVLQARLDRLQSQEKKLLQQSSVIGRVFWDELLLHLWESEHTDGPSPDIRDILDGLRNQAFIHRREVSLYGTAIEYSFKHDLLREVAYESVLLARRKQYHSLIAEWYMEHSRDELHDQAGLIAEHLIRAGREDQAVDFLIAAAESAAMRYANDEARAYYDRILEFPERLYEQHRWALLCGREKVLDFLGDREEQFRELSRMEAYSRQSADVVMQVEVGLRFLNYSEATRKYPDELKTATTTLALAQESSIQSLEARALLALGRVLALQGGDLVEAKEIIESAIHRLQALDDVRLAGHAERAMGVVCSLNYEFDSAIEHTQRALAFARKAQDLLGEVYARTNLAGQLNNSGDWQGSLEQLKRSQSLAQKIGNRRGEAYILSYLTSNAMRVGNYAHAEDLGRQCLRLLREIGDHRVEIGLLITLGLLAGRRKSFSEALILLEQADVIVGEINISEPEIASLLDAYCEVYAASGDFTRAIQYGFQAVQLRSSDETSRDTILSRIHLASAMLGEKRLEEAKEQVNLVLKHLKKQPNPVLDEDSPRIHLVCFKILEAFSDVQAAEQLAAAHQSLVDLSNKAATLSDLTSYLEKVPWNKEILELWDSQPR